MTLSALNFLKKLIPGHTIPAVDFERAAFSALKSVMTGKEAIADELAAIDNIYAAPLEGRVREAQAAGLYLKLEQYVSQDQPHNRISKENLRERIGRNCHAIRAEGGFSLIFLPSFLKGMRLSEHFTDEIIAKAGEIYGEDILVEMCKESFGKEPYLRETLERYWLHWRRLERKMQSLKMLPEAQERTLSEALGRGILIFYNLCVERSGMARTDLMFQDAYRAFRDNLAFVDEVAQALSIVPQGLLDDEKLALAPKSELEETVRKNTAELEVALSELERERGLLRDALEQLKKVDLAKSDFITVVSHQFRTPLSVLRWHAEILGNKITEFVPPERSFELRRMLAIMDEKIVFLVNILEDIYDVLAVERENVTVDKHPAQLWEIAHDTMKSLEVMADRGGVTLTLDQSVPALDEISIDRRKIARVCDILIRNAIQYTPKDGKVTVGVHKIKYKNGEALRCTITDTGIGIEPEDLSRIFTKFFRGKNAVTMAADGAGVGLYLAKRFVEAHGGTLEVNSALNEGSSFTFILPLK
ncbi:MAG: HAMP domain-containing sensor histidine kinase [bacterium]|nr:HAMP domain-containing sensor histidine kinase [bacterium]